MDISGKAKKKENMRLITRMVYLRSLILIGLFNPFILRALLTFWFSSKMNPTGHIHEQKTLPKVIVITKGMRADIKKGV